MYNLKLSTTLQRKLNTYFLYNYEDNKYLHLCRYFIINSIFFDSTKYNIGVPLSNTFYSELFQLDYSEVKNIIFQLENKELIDKKIISEVNRYFLNSNYIEFDSKEIIYIDYNNAIHDRIKMISKEYNDDDDKVNWNYNSQLTALDEYRFTQLYEQIIN